MAAKKSSSIVEIEKQIATLNSELQKARTQKLADAEKALASAKAGLTAANTKANELAADKKANAATKAKLLKVKADKAKQEQLVAKAQEQVNAAKTALEIANETAKVLAESLTPPKAGKKAAKPVKAKNKDSVVPKAVAAPVKKAKAKKSSAPHPKPQPVDGDTSSTAATTPVSRVSQAPGHATTSLIEHSDNSLPKPTPVN